MKQRIFAKTAMAAVLAGTCLAVHSLGLGEINVESNLNQRFFAVIPLSEINSEDLETVTVTLAPADAFDRAGIERNDYLTSLRFAVKNDGGVPRVVVTSPQIAREPVVNLLVQARWKGGKIVREYTVLLDPPALPKPRPAPVIAPAPVVAAALPPAVVAPVIAAPPKPQPPVLAAPKPQPAPVIARPEPKPELPPPPKPEAEFFETPVEARATNRIPVAAAKPLPLPTTSGETYGPIKPQETLWRVATNLRPNNKVAMEQVMLALVEANPGSIRNGITLSTGSMLRAPSLTSILAYSPREAKERLAAIQAGRKLPAAASTSSAPAISVPVPPKPLPLPPPPKVPVIAAPSTTPKPAAAVPVPVPPVPAAPAKPSQPAATAPEPAKGSEAPVTKPAEPAKPLDIKPVEAPLAEKPAESKPPLVLAPEVPEPEEPAAPSPLTAYWPLLAGAAAAGLLVFLGLRRVRKNPPAPAKIPAVPPKAAPRSTVTVSPPPPSRAGDTQVRNARALAADNTPFDPPAMPAMVVADLDNTRGPSVMAEGREGFEHVPQQAPAAAKPNSDPLADADFHLAYGLHDEAIDVLSTAIARSPGRNDYKLKLAEAYFAAGKPKEFQQLAEGLKDKVLPADWGKLAIMGAQLAPGAALFKAADEANAATDFDLAIDELPAVASKPVGVLSMDFAHTVPPPNSAAGLPNLANDLADDVGEAPKPSAKPLPPTLMPAEDPDSIDFMLGQSIVPLGMNLLAPPSAAARKFDASQEFNLGATSLNINSAAPPTELPSLESDYEISLQSLQVSLTPREVAPASDEELNTKLDLARAYVEMDDHESARGLLKEVLDQGSDQHKKEAEALMQRLPG